MKIKKIILHLKNFISKSILSRDMVNVVIEQEILHLDAATVYLDFSKVEFVSRSAAHELLKMKERFEYNQVNKKEIIFENCRTNVAEMIRLVAANRAYSYKKEQKFNPKQVNIKDLVEI